MDPIDLIPLELWYHVISLTSGDDLLIIAATCRLFRNIIKQYRHDEWLQYSRMKMEDMAHKKIYQLEMEAEIQLGGFKHVPYNANKIHKLKADIQLEKIFLIKYHPLTINYMDDGKYFEISNEGTKLLDPPMVRRRMVVIFDLHHKYACLGLLTNFGSYPMAFSGEYWYTFIEKNIDCVWLISTREDKPIIIKSRSLVDFPIHIIR